MTRFSSVVFGLFPLSPLAMGLSVQTLAHTHFCGRRHNFPYIRYIPKKVFYFFCSSCRITVCPADPTFSWRFLNPSCSKRCFLIWTGLSLGNFRSSSLNESFNDDIVFQSSTQLFYKCVPLKAVHLFFGRRHKNGRLLKAPA